MAEETVAAGAAMGSGGTDFLPRVRKFFRIWIPASAVGFFITGYVLGGIGEALFFTVLGTAGGFLAFYEIRKSYDF